MGEARTGGESGRLKDREASGDSDWYGAKSIMYVFGGWSWVESL